MMIQCNACSAAEATVMCCADEAALCSACDLKVHAANKLAGKHHRVPLLRAAERRLPTCDICQEASGYFFCLEDRALLCRNCDVSIHTANSHVSAHRRFLITGVQVGLEPIEPITPLDKEQSSSTTDISLAKGNPSVSFPEEVTEVFPRDLVANKAPFPGSSMFGGITDWPLNEFFGFPDSNQSYGFMDHYSSKADSGNFGSSEGSPPYYALGEGLDAADERWAQVPEVPWTVPEIPSPPTASGLQWQKNSHYSADENTMFVPDVNSSQGALQCRARATGTKRRKL